MARLQYVSILVMGIGAVMARSSLTQAQLVIDYSTTITQPGENIRVIRGANPDPPTTVNVEITEGYHVTGIDAFDSSVVNLIAGVFEEEDIVAHDTATVNAHGGDFEEGYLRAFDSGTINIHGGDFGDHGKVFGHNNATVNVYGGMFDDGNMDVIAFNSSSVNMYAGSCEGFEAYGASKSSIYGGEIDDIGAHESSVIDIWGGFVQDLTNGDLNTTRIFGGRIGGIFAGSESSGPSPAVVTVYGTDFNYPYGPIIETEGRLTGTLSNGDTVNAGFSIQNGASVVLQVPEPHSAVLLALAAPWCLSHAMRRGRSRPRSK